MSVLAKIRKAGFTVVLDGDDIKVKPASHLTPQQRDWLKQNKRAIIAELSPPQRPQPPLMSTVELLAILDGDHSVEAVNRRFREVLQRPYQAPRVTCKDCQHFQRDQIGFGDGIGQCAVDAETSPALWPNALRWCGGFTAR